jgi:glycerol-3-phosphate dehydrogenase
MGGVIARDLAAAAAAGYDVIVIGGGVNGIAVAHRAMGLGLRALLLERDDFGGATSGNSLRILHGGIRSLQSLDLRCFRDMFIAQSWFLQHLPEHIAPLQCLMPLYGNGLRRPAAFRAALTLDRLLRRAYGSGHGSDALPRGGVLDADQTRHRFPLVPATGLQGGGVWYDAVMRQPQRVLIDWLRWACAGGVTALNRVAAQQLLIKDGRVAGIVAHDRVGDRTVLFSAPRVINCAGPWSQELSRAFDPGTPECFRATLAFNLLLDRAPVAQCALAVATPTGSRRTYFIVPWGNQTMVGTYHGPAPALPQQQAPSREQVEQMLGELNTAVPGWDLGSETVLRVYSGLLPGRSGPGAEELETKAMIHDHGRSGGPQGLLTVAGVKFTTAPVIAARVLRAAGFRARVSVTQVRRPAAREIPEAASFLRALDTKPGEASDWVRRLAAEESVLSAEDFVRRRTDWGLDPREEREIERLITPLIPQVGAAPETFRQVRAG